MENGGCIRVEHESWLRDSELQLKQKIGVRRYCSEKRVFPFTVYAGAAADGRYHSYHLKKPLKDTKDKC
jgi:hypothetical protein